MSRSQTAGEKIGKAVRAALTGELPRWLVTASMVAGGSLNPVFAQNAQSGKSDDLAEVIISTEFFRPTDASSATKFDLPIQDTPQSISVLSADILETFNTRSLLGIDKFVAGIHSTGNDANVSYFTGFMQARGFVLDEVSGYKINGFSTIREFQPDLAVAERVEVVKGPSSVVYGVNNYGGTVNTVLKAPTATAKNSVSANLGSYGTYGATVDSGGPINDSGSLRYRFVGAYQDRKSIKDDFEFQRYPIFGRVQWDLSDTTTLDAYVLYQKETAVDDFGAVAQLDAQGLIRDPYDVDRSNLLGDASYNDIGRKSLQGFVSASHRFANDFTGSIKAGYSKNTHEYAAMYLYNYGFFNGPFTDVYTKVDSRTIKSSDLELSFGGDFELFGREHKLMLLAEARRIRYNFTLFPFDNLGTVNQFAPDFSTLGALDFDYLGTSNGLYDLKDDRFALGAQSLFSLTDRLSMLVGLRWDRVEQKITDIKFDPDTTDNVFFEEHNIQSELTKSNVTPRVAFTYKITPQINGYVSYSEGFIPQDGTTRGGDPIEPEKGVQYEVGLKGEFADGKLGVGLTGYSIKRKDVGVSDPSNQRGESFFVPGREQDHKGIEFELFGRVAPNLNLIATYAYLHTEITKDDVTLDPEQSSLGNPVAGAPDHTGSLFFQYEVPSGLFAKLSLSAGAAYVGARPSQERNVTALFGQGGGFPIYDHDSYTTVDAGLIYRGFQNLELSLQGTNLLDKDYFNQAQVPICCGPNLLQRGTSREFSLGVMYRFEGR